MEEWVDIPGFVGLYKVNRFGDVFSLYTQKVLKPSLSADGYKQYVLHRDRRQEIMLAHRAVALAFIPSPNDGLVVNHKDENKINNSVENLEWVTPKENINYAGNRAAQASAKKFSKRLFVYDRDLTLVDEVVGIKKYARENRLSDGGICTNAKYNSACADGNYRFYKGRAYSYHALR